MSLIQRRFLREHIAGRCVRALVAAGTLISTTHVIMAQSIVVDATPAHIANTFSPVRALVPFQLVAAMYCTYVLRKDSLSG